MGDVEVGDIEEAVLADAFNESLSELLFALRRVVFSEIDSDEVGPFQILLKTPTNRAL